MVKSMTGYGKSQILNSEFGLSVEIKSLNSKTLDLSVRIPKIFSEKEIDIKNKVGNALQRGKINVQIDFQRDDLDESKITIHKKLFKTYYEELKELAKEVKTDKKDLFRIALHLPNVLINPNQKEITEENWKEIFNCIEKAIKECDEFRKQEGKNLLVDIVHHIELINESIKEIEKKDPIRTEQIKTKLKSQLQEVTSVNQLDMNRFEQEIIYYLEKLDITEEKIRLRSHLDFFIQTMNEEGTPGKKLGFIAQEIGREINTIGSKANDATIQHQVVAMKEELEKIKEQLNNIL